jgi:two-component system nitrogen regulation response regulator GlnG
MADSGLGLIVEDDPGVRFVLERALQAVGLKTIAVETLASARDTLSSHSFSCAFVDIRLPDGSGLDLASEIAARRQRPFLVVMTAQDTVEHTIEAMRRGADEYLVKPFAVADIQQLARTAMERARDDSPAVSLLGDQPAHFGLIGHSNAMREVYKRIGRSAPTELPVLIEGESGTGKELVARAIHATSQRAAAPFVAVNLAALPKELVESELYGHEKGAFTGATAPKAGLFELADGGTILLDEIGEMPLKLQPKLLRALQEGEIARVGGGRPSRVNVRVVAATNLDLARAVAAGRFRADLYYRLRVLPLRLPPLRERQEDIPILAEHFIRRDGPRLRGKEMQLSSGAIELLGQHSWPGNVRELENALRAAMVAASDNMVTAQDIAGVIAGSAGAPATWEQSYAERVRAALGTPNAYDEMLKAAERIVLKEALTKSSGNQVRAAAQLGIHRNSLRRRLDELGISANGLEKQERESA